MGVLKPQLGQKAALAGSGELHWSQLVCDEFIALTVALGWVQR